MLSDTRIDQYAKLYRSHAGVAFRIEITRHVWAELGGTGLMLFAERADQSLQALIRHAQLDDQFARWVRRMERPSHRRRPRSNATHHPHFRREARIFAAAETRGQWPDADDDWVSAILEEYSLPARSTGRQGSRCTIADRRAWAATRAHN